MRDSGSRCLTLLVPSATAALVPTNCALARWCYRPDEPNRLFRGLTNRAALCALVLLAALAGAFTIALIAPAILP